VSVPNRSHFEEQEASYQSESWLNSQLRVLRPGMVVSDQTTTGNPRNLATHADGQRPGREPAAFFAYCQPRVLAEKRKPK
jgi:hypothetical protein